MLSQHFVKTKTIFRFHTCCKNFIFLSEFINKNRSKSDVLLGGPPKFFGVLGTPKTPKKFTFYCIFKKEFSKIWSFRSESFFENFLKFPQKSKKKSENFIIFLKIEKNYHFYIQISAKSPDWSKFEVIYQMLFIRKTPSMGLCLLACLATRILSEQNSIFALLSEQNTFLLA